ncbi:hypothetical protein EOS_38960 [Caballeronia mineralivorans PML1(12)]|uniref:Uncharacterized protein n=1 Tax=Caballeronia mineralivorans PML1(12) TaxID=908627 RepID=A0A0J1CJN4_9BURK|nr:hypothetical protein [Caballeronia mineralivorans]KLU20917.1 hypothetical protein EOS_38960 [Caballeronia mineralivorans PML1(12)]
MADIHAAPLPFGHMGSSKVTWQAMTGVGYAMKLADVSLAYRYLAFHGSNDQLMQTVRMSGPSLGATVRF